MKPLDPRLMRYAKSARNYIILITVTGLLSALLVIGQNLLIAAAASPVINDHVSIGAVWVPLVALVAVILTRVALIWFRESRAHLAATKAIREIRGQVLEHANLLGPRWRAANGANTVTTVTRGLADLKPYFTLYLPQLFLSVTVTPAALAVMLYFDFWSVVIAALVIPLIPIFMILIGRLTQEFSNRRLATMQQMGRQLLDLISGLATLKALGRENGPAAEIRKVGRDYTRTTMGTLRIAFLSGAVLEFISTLSVALVAVEMGWRLMAGHVDLFTGLVVIMLAPEVYEPIRQVGKQFHASTDGITACNEAFQILELPLPEHGQAEAPNLAESEITASGVSVAARGGWAPADLSFTLRPGTITALVGPSGVGKTTTAMALLGLQEIQRGTINAGQQSLTEISLESWWSQASWVPQHPAILPGTILENITEFREETPDLQRLTEAARLTGFDAVVEKLPQGWETQIGQGGLGLSVGQRQRLALLRAVLFPRQLMIFDEPTAHLDAALEQQVIKTLLHLREQGKTVVVVAHRRALIEHADAAVTVSARPFTESEAQEWAGKTEELAEIEVEEQTAPFILDLDMGLGGDLS